MQRPIILPYTSLNVHYIEKCFRQTLQILTEIILNSVYSFLYDSLLLRIFIECNLDLMFNGDCNGPTRIKI